MSGRVLRLDLLFDAEGYRRSGYFPWTFFAYPTSLAGADGLPPDPMACELLAEVQARGIDVAVWACDITDTTYFACKREDVGRLHDVITELESSDEFGSGFCASHSEALFALTDRGR